jgi:gluconolactonase
MYFTDPPYGMVLQAEDPARETPFQGVYLTRPSGEVVLLIDTLTRPNGIALMPDESQIIIANSDPEKVKWYMYDVKEDGTLENGKEFFNAGIFAKDYRGLPDGLKIDSNGNVFASGPGGIHIFDKTGKHLGIILTGQATANCAFGADETTLFITADMFLMKLQMRP